MKTRLLIIFLAVITVIVAISAYSLIPPNPVTLLEEIVSIEDCEKFEPKFDSWNEIYNLDETFVVPDELFNTGIRKAIDCTVSPAETIANTPCNELLTGIYPEYEDVTYQRIFDEKVIECTILTPFEWGFAFGEDPLGHYAEWCLDNNGFWNPKTIDCDFITEEAGQKANADLDARGTVKVGGIKAQIICEIVDIPCPKDVEFTGAYLLYFGKTYIHQWKQQTHFTFYFDEDDPTFYYKVCDDTTYDCSEYEIAKLD